MPTIHSLTLSLRCPEGSLTKAVRECSGCYASRKLRADVLAQIAQFFLNGLHIAFVLRDAFAVGGELFGGGARGFLLAELFFRLFQFLLFAAQFLFKNVAAVAVAGFLGVVLHARKACRGGGGTGARFGGGQGVVLIYRNGLAVFIDAAAGNEDAAIGIGAAVDRLGLGGQRQHGAGKSK